MRLTAIKLAGFKSFVDPTTLTLDADLTGIVGPNGCGKSNVIDAVRWVTGESSAKQLRGAALEDVIFNGSKGRKPVGRVAVELKFDNDEGKLGGQYARFAEISIRRELTRDGGSRYFINGSKARRRDVVDLFLGTGLGGRNNYAVIEQGAVNRLVEAKPDELRHVLEETAGISRYKERRRETENRIRHTRENLDRLNDLIGEVAQRLATLERQARNAERYKALKQDERRLRAQLLALRWRALDADVQVERERLTGREQNLAAVVSRQRQAHVARSEQERAQRAAAQSCQQQQTAFYDAQAEATRIAQALAHARELQQMQQRERDELSARQAQLATREREDEAALQQTRQAIARADADLASRQTTRDQAQAALATAEQRVEQAEQGWAEYNSGEQSPVARLQAERTQRQYLDKRSEQTRTTIDKRAAEAADLATDGDGADLHALAVQLDDWASRVKRDEQHSHELTEQLARVDADRGRQQVEADATRTRLAEQRARLAAEKAMQQAALREDDTAVREWLAAQGHADAPSVARLIKAPAEWQTAVEAALASWLSGFAVPALPQQPEWPSDTLTLVETADETAAAAATEQTPTPADLPSLASRITAPTAVMAAARRIFVADDIATALAARGQLVATQTIITLDGACVGPAMLRTPAAAASEHGVLKREQNIKTLAAECGAAEQQMHAFEQALTRLEQQRTTLRDESRTLDEALTTARRELAQKQAEHQGEQIRQQQRRQRADELAAELAPLREQWAAEQGQLQALDQTIEALQIEAETHTRERDTVQTALAQARQARSTTRQDFDATQARVRQLEQERAAAQSRLDSLTTRLDDTQATKAQIDARLAALAEQTASAEVETAPQQADHDAAKAQREAAEAALRASRDALHAAEKRSEEAARAVMQADTAVEQARETMQQARIAVETAGARRDGLIEQLDEVDADVDQLLATLDSSATVDAWHGQIEAVERKIARLGAINLAAIEEHDAEAEREQYLAAQHADLSAALETLETAIARIDRETRSRFKDTFSQVNERFGIMFPTLFGGGRAALELTEDDLLSTGVRVMARPPGKRNASIQMLSGGEKAMTALALLFALFELNPAPFCMLDEIDAPLDDANVARFCELVRQMSARVQFIIITHNKLTMELAEQLHGVTMVEPGVSRLVSVNIDQALDMAG